jgi:DNA end-binding protein Ku
MWAGTISFGMVSVPVKLYAAVTPKTVHFHQLHATDHARIRQKRVCPVEDEEVPFNEIVKGFEIAPDRYVVIEPEEFAALEPAFTRSIDIEDFVELEEIDPIYLEHPYYLVPAKGGAKAYCLLMEAMRDTGKVAIARIVMRSRERLVAIRPHRDALLMTTMSFGDEVQQPGNLKEMEDLQVELAERELKIARRLVESIAEPFDISKYSDNYREALLDLIDRKAAGEEVAVEPPSRQERLESPDLMSALQASLEEVRRRGGATDGAPARKGARKRASGEELDGAVAAPKKAPARSSSATARKGKAGKSALNGSTDDPESTTKRASAKTTAKRTGASSKKPQRA